MPDDSPLKPLGNPARDAEKIRDATRRAREQVEREFALPPGALDPDSDRNKKLEDSSIEAGKLTAILALVSRTVPGRVGAAIGSLLVGAHKSPDTGKLTPASSFPLNLAPSPLGYGQPAAYGLPPNWWLPRGSTDFLPAVADRLKLGIPQQRQEDERRALRQLQDRLDASQIAAARAVAGESDQTLQDIITGARELNRASVVIATTSAGFADLQAAARAELAQRRAGPGAIGALLEPPAPPPGESDAVTALQDLARLLAANPPDP